MPNERALLGAEVESRLHDLCPDFPNIVADERYLWDEDDGTLHVFGVFAMFTHYISDRLVQANTAGLQAAFDYVETLVAGGGQASDAATTNFLENLVNRVHNGLVDPALFAPLLGPESRAFCRAWYSWDPKGGGVDTPSGSPF